MRKSLVIAVSGVLIFPNNGVRAAGQSCQQIQAAIREHGSIILHYQSGNGGSIQRYDRFVANLNECPAAFNTLKVRRVPALDADACPLHICWNND